MTCACTLSFQVNGFVDSETVILTSNHNRFSLKILNRMVSPMMAMSIFKGLAPLAKESNWCPRQIPKRNFGFKKFSDCTYRIVTRLRISWTIRRKIPSGFNFSASSAEVCAGTIERSHPFSANNRSMLFLMPKNISHHFEFGFGLLDNHRY
ncbi:MAG: hypothetical protein Ct9H90mP27_5060 [Gammaproteobacteria bacterium]|nr:MAG: hypothetical protein Ct9H90mP27_5060 [Gammaproteobacteria bacterium]